MNRDAILATLIGLALGLLITGILVVGPTLVTRFPKFKLPNWSFSLPTTTKIPTPTTQVKPAQFSVTSPLPEAIEEKDQLLVSGSAPPQSMVVIAGILDEDIVSVGNDTKFAGKITLAEGKNQIAVTQYLNGKSTSTTLTVYYTSENF